MTRKRLRTLRYSKQMVDDVSQLVYLHCGSTATADGRWTDSAVRRYVTDAGPLLPAAASWCRRLHHRNKRRAARLQANYGTSWKIGSPTWPPARTWPGVRPDLDGNEIMELSRHPGGPAGWARPGVSEGVAAGTRAAGSRRGAPNCWRGGTRGGPHRLIRYGLLPGGRDRHDVDRTAGCGHRR